MAFKGDGEESPRLRRRTSLRNIHLTAGNENLQEAIFEMMSSYLSTEPFDIQQFIVNHIEYTLARSRHNFDFFSAYKATAYSVRDRLIEFWNDTNDYFTQKDVKRVYYLSIEYLMGRSLQNALINLGIEQNYKQALMNFGYRLEDIYEQERDAALGNGGLGRLAACFLDSLATTNYPAWGYGIRYTYGMFKQYIHDGFQSETPDFWLTSGNPWEIERNDVWYYVKFFGHTRCVKTSGGKLKYRWEGGETVIALAYDTPIPGFGTTNTLTMRLWSSRPSSEFNLESFNRGDYYGAIEEKQKTENITSVLYPDDSTTAGRELRLKQQYFFCCATLSDIIRRFKKTKKPFETLGDYAAIQLNDTHPTIAIPELMRILVDLENLEWEKAWDITTRVFAYTNHTVLPEALERWDVPLISSLLPRHIQIIYDINAHFLKEVEQQFGTNWEVLRDFSIIEEGEPKKVRMAWLAIIGSHSVNGVAAIHSQILKDKVFKKFYEFWPQKFNNKTNGVTPRRWLLSANPQLSELITDKLGSNTWATQLDLLQVLRKHANDEAFQRKFMEIKTKNKERLAELILRVSNGTLVVDPNALFDVQVKRIHEYKRQLLNILHVIHRYLRIKNTTVADRQYILPRVNVFGGKAAPAYHNAKMIIKLINSVADVVNKDQAVGDLLKIVYIPDYNVSSAQTIIPASDISEHISTAGTEASGTSNMKFALNGGLIIGTLDGANIEIREQIGKENMFIFGAVAEDVDKIRSEGGRPIDERLFEVLTAIQNRMFGDPGIWDCVLHQLWAGSDYYLIANDFTDYVDTQNQIDEVYIDRSEWAKRCIMSVAGMGFFSSDRTIRQYADEIWKIQPCKVPEVDPGTASFTKVLSSANISKMERTMPNTLGSLGSLSTLAAHK
eukprot:TRINITY_DN1429_c0_g1_i2.p1 TRINITY_DN1429_c0_g1~~TRINITY_DN1429_c0_g1_i2.p1  ORF type:complete len:929 (-),score=217.90 TRINITY_DN1429_c0_g1_i2:96-2783(-)